MKMICDVPSEVIKSVRMGTWCGSSVAEKMIANGIPLEQLRAEIEELDYITFDGITKRRCLEIIDKYKADREALAECYKPKLKSDLCIMDEFAFEPKADRSEE